MAGKKLFIICVIIALVASSYAATPVETHGQLKTSGSFLLNKDGKIVQLRGMSFFWSTPEWPGYKYYTAATVDALVDTWKCTVLRIAYDRDKGNDKGWAGCQTVIDRAIQRGIYVIIDWHSHTAHEQEAQAISFFTQMATKYKNTPNVLFEPYNEPITAGGAVDGSATDAEKTWKAIRPYFNNVIKAIRGTGNNNLVIVGTPYYCQFPYIAMANPPAGSDGKPFSNVAYSFHFYAASHGPEAYYVKNESGLGGEEGNYFTRSLNKLPLFITEWGTTHSDGGEGNKHTYIDAANTKWWFDKINGEQHISHCNWSVSDFQPSSAFNGSPSSPSTSGAIVKQYLNVSTDAYGMASDTGKSTKYKDSVFATPRTIACYKYGRYWGGNVDSVTVSYSSRDNADPREAKTTAIKVSTGINDEYVVYQVNATSATKFIKIRALSKDGTGTIDVLLDGTKVGSITIPKNAEWTTSVFSLNVPTGKHTLKFAFTGATGTYYMNWFELTNDSTITSVKFTPDKAGLGNLKLSMIKNGFIVSLPVSHRLSSYNLIGVDGRVVKSGDLRSGMSQLNFDNLSSGTWLLKVNGTDGSRVFKTVVKGN